MLARTALFAAFNVLAVALAPPIPAGVKAAPSQAPAQFEVASVKANTSGDAKVAIQMLPGGRFTATNPTSRRRNCRSTHS